MAAAKVAWATQSAATTLSVMHCGQDASAAIDYTLAQPLNATAAHDEAQITTRAGPRMLRPASHSRWCQTFSSIPSLGV
jgi:hypothetical protein